MPLIRRVPKRGFSNEAFRIKYAIVNVGDLERFDSGTVIDEKLLRAENVVRGNVAGVKVLSDGALTKKLTVKAMKISGAAREKIEKAGGSVTLE